MVTKGTSFRVTAIDLGSSAPYIAYHSTNILLVSHFLSLARLFFSSCWWSNTEIDVKRSEEAPPLKINSELDQV